ncbi:CvfB family protein [Anaerobium acetethylicum]|uniref:S1 motif domain-containing protein n=1 Tax=Anaerobium acetethylicum TaxID=1619234 RepID=A0A1D3TQ93_9FIRM|nr:S1-like domain-containing RNA-binding protein [Anaerobium acetethylicum]SCP95676.1 hypothetical protein SAMN05421730_1002113 [Anaerobium acetethylicum]
MIELGKKQKLMVVKEVEFGVYVGEHKDDEDRILLPKKQVPAGTKPGDEIEVFVYKDSKDRIISTTNEPKLQIGQVALLKVVEVGTIGAFLDWGLEKDLLLPFKEQTKRVRQGEEYLVTLYVDKSKRLCATMKIYECLRNDSPYQKDDKVMGMVYEISEEFGAFVAVDNIYSGLIPKKEMFGNIQVGDSVEARVTAVKEDGKLDLSIREKAHLQMDTDAEAVMKVIESYEGILPFNDRVSPEIIKMEFDMSKNAFKRAVGRLLKEGRIEITEKNIKKIK